MRPLLGRLDEHFAAPNPVDRMPGAWSYVAIVDWRRTEGDDDLEAILVDEWGRMHRKPATHVTVQGPLPANWALGHIRRGRTTRGV